MRFSLSCTGFPADSLQGHEFLGFLKMAKGVLFATQAYQNVGGDVRVFGDPPKNSTEGSMFDSIECHPATAIVGKSNHSIDVRKILEHIWIEVSCDSLGNTCRAVDRRDHRDVVASANATAWTDVPLKALTGEPRWRSWGQGRKSLVVERMLASEVMVVQMIARHDFRCCHADRPPVLVDRLTGLTPRWRLYDQVGHLS